MLESVRGMIRGRVGIGVWIEYMDRVKIRVRIKVKILSD